MRYLAAVRYWSPRLLVLTWLVAHLLLTLLYCFPLTPLKSMAEPVLFDTIGRYFSQNWSLFAPNPVTTNHSVLAQCLDQTGAASESLAADGWRDITLPLLRAHQANRFSAYDRLSRVQSNAVRSYLGGDSSVEPLEHACRGGDHEACAVARDRIATIRKSAVVPLVKAASAFCSDTGAGDKTVQVALRIRATSVAPWSKRDDNEKGEKSTDIDVGRYAFDRNVPANALFTENAE